VQFDLPPHSTAEYRIDVPLTTDQNVVGTIAVSGGRDDVRLVVFAADGSAVVRLRTVSGETQFTWPVTRRGPWRVVFDNAFSLSTGKHVTFTYRIVTR
jgi:hypothetical protein